MATVTPVAVRAEVAAPESSEEAVGAVVASTPTAATSFRPGAAGAAGGASYSTTGGGIITPAGAGTAPSITISYSAPGTTIDGPHGRVESRKPRKRVVFEFTSSIAAQTFECSLDGADFAACETPFSRKLKAGRHKLLVAAVDPETGNSDPTPAKGKVRIVHKP